ATSRRYGGPRVTTRPPGRTTPAVGGSRPAAIRKSGVFPQPDGPTRTSRSPSPGDSVTARRGGKPLAEVLGDRSSATSAILAKPRDLRVPGVTVRCQVSER